MKRTMSIALIVFTAVLIAACGYGPATNTANNANANANANANVAKSTAAAPAAADLMAIEKKAVEAWSKKDTKYFEGLLSDSFVGYMGGKRVTRADELKMIAESKCDVKSISLTEEKVTPVGPDAAVLTTKSTVDATCDGQKIPSPMRAATLYVRSGSEWKAAYHNDVPISDPKSPPVMPPAPPKKDDAKMDGAKLDDALTTALMAVETKGWEAWKAQNADMLKQTLTNDVGVVNIWGVPTYGQAENIKNWTTGKCEIKSAGPVDGMATSITPTVAVLTFKGNADGTCEGQKLHNLWGTSIYVKEGDAWKAAYIFEAPA